MIKPDQKYQKNTETDGGFGGRESERNGGINLGVLPYPIAVKLKATLNTIYRASIREREK